MPEKTNEIKHRSSSIAGRRANSIESFRNCASDLGEIRSGSSIFAITRGQWSMIDAILYVLDCCASPCKISLWTWTIAEYEIQCFQRLRMDRRISEGLLVIDGGARTKNSALISDWQSGFGQYSVRYVRNHAKIATIESETGLRFCLRGSMNLNQNPRFEQFDLTEGGKDFDLVREIEMTLPILADNASNCAVIAATRVRDAFLPGDLKVFGLDKLLKVWAK